MQPTQELPLQSRPVELSSSNGLLGHHLTTAQLLVCVSCKLVESWLTSPDYLANCGGDCTTVDKSTLEWFKIDAQGLYDDTTVPGNWASDTLIANNNSWTVTIPSDIASGNYVLRHEIIALHSAGESDGAQNYPQCVNLMITGTGTATPSGTLGTALYSETDAGILVNIYSSLSTYVIPGPTLYSGAISMSETQMPSATAVGTGVASDATGAAVVASSAAETTAAAAASSTSAAAGVVAASSSSIQVAAVAASSAAVTTAPVFTSVPFSNSTAPTSSKSKSACKAKSSVSKSKTKSACKAKSTSSVAISGINVAVAQTSAAAIETTFAASVTIATTAAAVTETASVEATTTASSSSASSTSSVTEPEGTTLNDLISWISSFFSSHSGTAYDANTVARRHARDIAQREMDKFSGAEFQRATGTAAAGGAHPTHHHNRPSGTGSFSAGSAQATGHSHHSHGSARPSGLKAGGGKGSAMPSGAAMPTNARSFKSAEW